MGQKAIKSQIVPRDKDRVSQLEHELERAKADLFAAQADLAEEQAQVNAFRMHSRLKLDSLVDTLLELRAQQQAVLTEIALTGQGGHWPALEDGGSAFWDDEDAEITEEEEDFPLLPTATPRDKAAEKRLYRELARRFHPDLGKNGVERAYRTTVMAAVNRAHSAGDMEALYDLAGELQPDEVAELAGIENKTIRRLRRQVMKLRHLQGKVRRQMQGLRQDNTAQLWRRARSVESRGGDWWSLVREELKASIRRRERELESLQRRAEQLRGDDPDDLTPDREI